MIFGEPPLPMKNRNSLKVTLSVIGFCLTLIHANPSLDPILLTECYLKWLEWFGVFV